MIMRYLKGTKDYMLIFRKSDQLEVIRYSNSDFDLCVDFRKSTFGYIFLMAGRAMSWKSVKQSSNSTPTIKAEFMTCFEALMIAKFYFRLWYCLLNIHVLEIVL